MLCINLQFNLMNHLVSIFEYFLAPLVHSLLLITAKLTHFDPIFAIVVAQEKFVLVWLQPSASFCKYNLVPLLLQFIVLSAENVCDFLHLPSDLDNRLISCQCAQGSLGQLHA